MKIKKIISLLLVALLLFSGIRFTLATETLTYEKAQELAEQYIDNSSEDEYWKGKNPIISDSTYFYTDNEEKASYIEFKVSCDDERNCGFIMLNIDGDDVAVPIASTTGVGPSEILKVKIDTSLEKSANLENNKFYYFSPFHQYLENQTTKEVVGMLPEEDIDLQIQSFEIYKKKQIKQEMEENKGLEKSNTETESISDIINNGNLTQEEIFDLVLSDYEKSNKELEELKTIELDNELIENKRTELKKGLQDILSGLKQGAKEFKKTQEFKEQKEQIKEQIFSVPEKKYVSVNLKGANALYNSPGTSNTFVEGPFNSGGCTGQTPCYNQFDAVYNNEDCQSGCTPTALGIAYGYHANTHGYTLFPGGTPGWYNSTNVNAVIKYLGDEMGTECIYDEKNDPNHENGAGGTHFSNIDNGKSWPRALSYSNANVFSYDNQSINSIFGALEREIGNYQMPIILSIKHDFAPGQKNFGNHTIVCFGYRYTTGSEKVARCNMGYGTSVVDGNNYIRYSNIDQNLTAMYLGLGTFISKGYATVNIE